MFIFALFSHSRWCTFVFFFKHHSIYRSSADVCHSQVMGSLKPLKFRPPVNTEWQHPPSDNANLQHFVSFPCSLFSPPHPLVQALHTLPLNNAVLTSDVRFFSHLPRWITLIVSYISYPLQWMTRIIALSKHGNIVKYSAHFSILTFRASSLV